MSLNDLESMLEKSEDIFVPSFELWEKLGKSERFEDFIKSIKIDSRFLTYDPDPDLGFPSGPLVGLKKIVEDKDAVKNSVVGKLDDILLHLSQKDELKDIAAKTKHLKDLIEKAFESNC